VKKQLQRAVWISLFAALAGAAIAQRQRARNTGYHTAQEAE